MVIFSPTMVRRSLFGWNYFWPPGLASSIIFGSRYMSKRNYPKLLKDHPHIYPKK